MGCRRGTWQSVFLPTTRRVRSAGLGISYVTAARQGPVCRGRTLVGFCKEGDAVLLLFGEVKTSSDSSTPPNVMMGSGGMAWQLKERSDSTSTSSTHCCSGFARDANLPSTGRSISAAVCRYVQSLGKEILLVGILLRDTEPNELDVTGRAKALAESLTSPTRIEITAWYLPIPINDWPALVHGGAP